MQGLSLEGLIFMIFGWVGIITLNIYCFYHIFREKKEKIIGPLEVETELDKIDR